MSEEFSTLHPARRLIPRVLHQRPDHLNFWDNVDFFSRFRLTKNTVQNLVIQIQDEIQYPTRRNAALTPLQQILLTLRFYATGSFQNSVGDHSGVHQSTACKIIKRVTTTLCRLKPVYINLPEEDEIIAIQQGFFGMADFPRVLLVVDGTHIKIQSPGGDQAEWFRNRKGFFSINAMVACDHQLRIRNIVASWPGSANNMIVFMNSNLKHHFQRRLQNCLILGDSGYAVEKYFMIPLDNPVTPAELRYQESLVRTRNIIERCIGVWKRRFPCLSFGLRTKIETAQDIIVATAILHNIAVNQGDPLPDINSDLEALINIEVPQNVNIDYQYQLRNTYREQLINNYFANL
ncbi:hypothetical protein NQ315_004998 [Exocentrus adspersus]|uniref:Putative nuclease HARBI1 n=1 Tax=Exocentrus adspersus TaxID=1586481 RepID=A0AAV8V7T3_9CUCU|nr:hypothetical protein NQ315_004998 [Exocentrus adspersus]